MIEYSKLLIKQQNELRQTLTTLRDDPSPNAKRRYESARYTLIQVNEQLNRIERAYANAARIAPPSAVGSLAHHANPSDDSHT